MSIARTITALRSGSFALCVAGTLLFASPLLAAGQGKAPPAAQATDALATYKADRAACMSGATNQDRATCLKEAGAAREERTRSGLGSNTDQARLESNRLRRCDYQPPADRHDCIRRMNGEGTTTGSVQSGGIYRELVIPVDPAKQD